MKKKKKRPVTLIEIMIVILLIGIIGGALAFNMRGSLDEGKKFKTNQNKDRVRDILEMELSKGDKTPAEIQSGWEAIVTSSPLANGEKTLVDGKGNKFHVEIKDDHVTVTTR